MTPALRTLNLTAHVISSVGWLGAVASFLVLSIAGLSSQDADIVRGAYVAMNLIGQFVIVPLSLAALLTGLVQSLGTHWGLFRHYWVLVKFTLSVGATALLLLHQFTAVAGAARRVSEATAGTLPDVGPLGPQLVGDAAFAVLVLLATAILSVYKPWGRTRYGQRKLHEQREAVGGTRTSSAYAPANPHIETTGDRLPLGLTIVLAIVGVIVAMFVVLHLIGNGLGTHGH